MKLTPHKSNIVTLKAGDPNFLIKDGMVMSPRAGFEISQSCPREYRMIISECIDRGWLKPVAYMLEKEYMWEKLCD